MPATSQVSRVSRTTPSAGNSALSNVALVRNGVMIPSPLDSSTASTIAVSETRYGVKSAHTRRASCSEAGAAVMGGA